MDSYMASNGSCFMVAWTFFFINHFLEVGLTQRPGDHGTPNVHNCWFILVYHVWGPAWMEFIEIALVEGPVTYDFTLHLRICDHINWFWRCLGTTFGHFLLGSHNFMVTALGSWPLHSNISHQSERPKLVQGYFTLEDEHLRIQKNYDDWIVYIISYMANYK